MLTRITTLALALALTLTACRPEGVDRALDAANAALGATRVAVTEASEAHKQLVVDAARACGSELGAASTPEQRRSCLERRGFAPEQIQKFEEALEKVAAGYDLIVEALGLIEQGWSEAKPHIGGAR